MPRRILIIEDEQAMRDRLSALARQIEDVHVDSAADEQQADVFIAQHQYDVALVDLQLSPTTTGRLKGIHYVKTLSARGCQTIIVTGDTRDVIGEVSVALSSDIITKPIVDAVLLGHVERALQWRNRDATAGGKLPPELVIDPFKRSCCWRNKTIRLTPTELSIVSLIWHAEGKRVDLTRLGEALTSGGPHSVTQHIMNIRRKFEDVDPDFNKIHCSGGAYFWER
jgi:DNA-binding response OmpR family regulator